jgi:predicted transcriptional regulator
MEVRITPELEAELAHIATRTGRTPEQLAADALALGMEAEQRFLKAVEQGIASADAGRFVDDEQVLAWLEQQEASERS